ncbi:uncharacterized protein RB166_021006 [Leptodactylus fuscus]|uniref:uncharacterized protein LOC142186709 n=1 Tax=Leptodactylus fuscus TaxID=238119 RepID=UPI003F4E68DA
MSELMQAIHSILKIYEKYCQHPCPGQSLKPSEMEQLIQAELSDAIKNTGDPETINLVMKAVDRNRDGEISFKEYITLVCVVAKAYYKHVLKEQNPQQCLLQQGGQQYAVGAPTPQSSNQVPTGYQQANVYIPSVQQFAPQAQPDQQVPVQVPVQGQQVIAVPAQVQAPAQGQVPAQAPVQQIPSQVPVQASLQILNQVPAPGQTVSVQLPQYYYQVQVGTQMAPQQPVQSYQVVQAIPQNQVQVSIPVQQTSAPQPAPVQQTPVQQQAPLSKIQLHNKLQLNKHLLNNKLQFSKIQLHNKL